MSKTKRRKQNMDMLNKEVKDATQKKFDEELEDTVKLRFFTQEPFRRKHSSSTFSKHWMAEFTNDRIQHSLQMIC
jgi:hypothetical protein